MVLVTILAVIPLGLLKNVDSLAVVCTASIGFYLCLVIKVNIQLFFSIVLYLCYFVK